MQTKQVLIDPSRWLILGSKLEFALDHEKKSSRWNIAEKLCCQAPYFREMKSKTH